MNHSQWFAQLKQGLVDKLLLFHGEEEYVKESALRQLQAALLPEAADWNIQIFDGGNGKLDVSAVIAACETLPFMAERRLVVLRDTGWFKGKEDAAAMVAYLPKVPATACLLFYEHGGVDKRKKIFKTVQQQGTDVSFDTLDVPERIRWLTREVQRAGKNIHLQAAQRLAERVPALVELAGRVEQLLALAETEITMAHVDVLVPATLEDDVFRMVEQIAQGQKGQALASLRMLLQGGKDIIQIIAAIARNCRQLAIAKALQERNTPVGKWAGMLGVPSFVAERMARSLPRLQSVKLQKNVQYCLQADLAVKTGGMRDQVAVEWLVLKLLE